MRTSWLPTPTGCAAWRSALERLIGPDPAPATPRPTAGASPAQWRALSTTAENLVREHPEIGRAWFNLGYTKLALREAEGTVDAFQRALTLGYRPATTAYNLACAHALLEQPDQALTWLSRAEAAGLKIADLALWDPDLSPLRSDPRFRAMAATWTRQRNAEWTEKLSEKSTEKRSKQRAERLAKLLLEQRK
jgi:tetratricopeptide (TPR) repeat protein